MKRKSRIRARIKRKSRIRARIKRKKSKDEEAPRKLRWKLKQRSTD